jgi:hypothetical protein
MCIFVFLIRFIMKVNAIPSFKSLDLTINKQAAKDHVMETIY